jgi:hypothetical protein
MPTCARLHLACTGFFGAPIAGTLDFLTGTAPAPTVLHRDYKGVG